MLSEDGYIRWRSVVKNGIDNAPALSKNAADFLEDLETRFDRYRRQTNLSDKQIAWLMSIEEDLKEELGIHYEQWEE